MNARPDSTDLVQGRSDGLGEGDEILRVYRASFAQERFWILDKLSEGRSPYNIVIGAKLTGELDVEALQRSFTDLVKRHATLRTTFAEENGTLKAYVHRRGQAICRTYRCCEEGDRDAELMAWTVGFAATKFNLKSGPMIRFFVLKRDVGEHVLVIVAHHIVVDAVSSEVICMDVSRIYRAQVTGSAIVWGGLGGEYADFAEDNRQRLSADQCEEAISYWQRELGFGTDREAIFAREQETQVPDGRDGKLFRLSLSRSGTERLKEAARKERCSILMVALTAISVMLRRFTGSRDIVIGIPVTERDLSMQGVVGCFLNAVPVRISLAEGMTLRELLHGVREKFLEALERCDLPFDMLVAGLRPRRVGGHVPVCDVWCAMQPPVTENLRLRDVVVESLQLHGGSSRGDIWFILEERGGMLHGLIEYPIDKFQEAVICRWASSLEVLLEAVVDNLDVDIARLPILGPNERNTILVQWNQTRWPFKRGWRDAVQALFEQQVRRAPGALAVVYEQEQLSYEQLNGRANQLAHWLRDQAVGPESIVGVCMERSVELIVSLLGVLKAGAAYLPLDPQYPQERLGFMLEDAGVEMLLTQESVRERLPLQYRGRLLCVDGQWGEITPRPTESPAVRLSPQNLAYVIYTSGSTGRPKGVGVSHRSIVNRLLWGQSTLALQSNDRVLQKTTTGFDVSVWELFWPLAEGACLVMARPGGQGDPAYLCKAIEEHGITVVHFVPSMLAAFLAAAQTERCVSLKQVICSGEALSGQLSEEFFRRCPTARLHNLYGPTEAAVEVSSFTCDPQHTYESVPMGRPIANTQLHVLDEYLEPVPVGVVGELYIGGVQLARGYLHRAGLTAERFIANPYGEPGSRLYRTGDLARYRPEGDLEYVGRIDHQVKIRGFRIELGEIEAALRTHPAVKDAVVVVQEPSGGERQLVGYVVGEPRRSETSGEGLSTRELREHLRGRLPEYMVPAFLLELQGLPLTSSGKLDRGALPAVQAGQLVREQVYVAPRTAVEEALAAIWSQVLGVERIGIHDNFFELGGHSLLATQVVSRIREELGSDVALRVMFERPTLEGILDQIEQNRREQQGLHLPQLKGQLREGAVPMSFAQERLWFLEQLSPMGATYHIPTRLRLSGELDVQALQRALESLVERHESLRTRFERVDNRGVQLIDECGRVSLQQQDLSALQEPERSRLQEQLARQQALEAFDLSSGPLLRAQLLKLQEEEHLLQLTLHHVVTDGWSAGVLIRELGQLYGAYREDRTVQLPALPVQYADYALWQRQWLQGEQLQRQLEYWRGQLAGAVGALDLPTDRPRPARQSFRGGARGWELDASLSTQLRELARSRGATLYMVLLATFQVLLSRWSGQKDIVVGSPIAGRTHKELEGLIGFFVNTLVLRTKFTGDPSFTELLGQVKETALGAYAHQDIPFEKLVQELQPQRDLSRSALFQVCFTYNVVSESWEFPGLQLQQIGVDTATSKFDLTLMVLDRPGAALEAVFEYAADLFDEATIARLVSSFQVLLEGIVAGPQSRLSQLPVLAEAERQQLWEWNRTQVQYPQLDTLSELFEQQVRRAPGALAVVYEQEQLSYEQLNGRANQLAHWLRDQAVGPESIVGVCMERSVELIVSLLGVLKAGAAYLPLDPQYPQERLGFMLEDAGVEMLLTQESVRERLPLQYRGRLLCVDGQWGEITPRPTESPAVRLSPQNLAYVIYTSGSTGRPKGVGVTQECVGRLFQASQGYYGFGAEDVWTLFHSYAFDFSVWEMWGALLYGGRLVVVPYWASRAPEQFHALLAREKVTVLSQTPSAFAQLLRVDQLSKQPLALRWVVFGGEALSVSELGGWYERHADTQPQLVNMYGITETTVHVTWYPVRAEHSYPGAASLIGRPLPDLQVYVLDEHLQQVPIGVIGEMYVAGAGLARGYLHRAGLTAERFIANPYGEPGSRLYRTGDLARYRPEGDLEYVGRIDHQVKIRGFRIELGEIEAALRTHPAVKDAVVVVQEPSGGERQLVGYVVGEPRRSETSGEGLSTRELREHLRGRLPEYMVPAFLLELQGLPLTSSGKLDRGALPAVQAGQLVREQVYVAPRTAVEEALAAIWSQVLGVERIGIHDNFFELGGDSIKSVSIIALSRERNLKLLLQDLFRYQTIASLASLTEPADSSVGLRHAFELLGREDQALLSEDLEDAYPLTQLQSGMLYHMQLLSDKPSPDYHNLDNYVLRLAGTFDAGIFQAAVDRVVQRHAVLRTTFDFARFSEPMQLVHRNAQLRVQVEDIRALSSQQHEERAGAIIREQSVEGFDLSSTPLLRLHVLWREDELIQLIITECHAILDGWSLHTVIAEIWEGYFALLSGSQLPAVSAPASYFRDFVALERAALQSSETEQFWKDTLQGATLLQLPRRGQSTDPSRPRTQRYSINLPVQLAQDLRVRARALALPLKSLMLCAHARVLSLLGGGQRDVLFGMSMHGRPEQLDGQRVCGLFLNTVPVRIEVRGTWDELARAAFEAEWHILPHRRYPLASIQQRHHGGEALFEVLFNYLNFHVLKNVLQSEQIQVLPGSSFSEPSSFVLSCSFYVDPASTETVLLLDYHTSVFSEERITELAGYYLKALESLAYRPDEPCSSTVLLSEAERQQLWEWNRTQVQYPQLDTLSELFEQQVRRAPGALAVVYEQEQLSYEQLNGRANQLAHWLRDQAVGPESIVGVCMERSVELIVSLLGVLKAGAAYLPLDPQYPQERLGFMLEDAGVEMLLTQESVRERLPLQYRGRLLCVDGQWGEITPRPTESPAVRLSPQNLAYVIYTSGSTGRPKGVGVSHRSIVNRLLWGQSTLALQSNDRVLQKTTTGFDVSVWELFWPLAEGACLVMARPGGQGDPAYLCKAIEEHGITVVHFVPSMLAAFLAAAQTERCVSLKQVICSGEALSGQLSEEFFRRCPTARLHNLYGPTEAAVEVSSFTCDPQHTYESVPMGRPIANTQLHVLDEYLEPVPVGVVGELYIGGVQLARGYLHRAGLTAERFIANPYGEPGSRLYRTGDLARYRPEGDLEYVGRIDHQVKIRGFRIELGEIEAALRTHPAVKDAVVVVQEPSGGERQLVGYVVGEPRRSETSGEGLSTRELREHLRGRLPEYMVPAFLLELQGLPLTSSGKLDRGALPAVQAGQLVREQVYVAPRTAVEEALAAIWSQVLGVERIGIHDNFFELGGHSLLAIQVIERVRKLLTSTISVQDLFASESLEQFGMRAEYALHRIQIEHINDNEYESGVI